MNRSRLEPLGVPGTEYDIEEAASRHGPSALDRWLLKQIVTRLGPESPVRATLWDTPDVAPRDGAVSVRILDRKALWQIVVADISMSLDNVLAVAGAAREHPWIMAGGLILSIALMGFAATFIARLLDRYRWLAWVGLLVIVYVALSMIWEGGWEIEHAAALL